MTFLKFLDYTYQNAAVGLQKEFSFEGDGETKAVQMWMRTCRWSAKWKSVVTLVFKFWLVQLDLMDPPTPVEIPKPDLKVAPAETTPPEA